MLNKLQKKITVNKASVVLLIVGVLWLTLMVLSAWDSAKNACRQRWSDVAFETQYTTDGCIVQISPNRWVNERKLEKDIQLTVREK